MGTFWQILIAILVLNVLIMVHEFGHYIAARAFKVRIREFAIGMGPAVFKKEGRHGLFSLRAFPIGGYLAMEGEDEASDDPDSFTAKKRWQRFLIVAAGAMMNLLLGLLFCLIIVLGSRQLPSRTVDVFFDGAVSSGYGLREGDEILKIDDTRVMLYSDAVYALTRNETGSADITVRRNGEKVRLENVMFRTEKSGDITVCVRDFYFAAEPKTFGSVIRHTFGEAVSFSKLIYQTLGDLLRGKYGISEISGPVGTVGIIGEAASQGWDALVYLAAFITINLGIFNLLPIPALDGGKLFFIVIEMIRRRPIPAKYENAVHMVGFALLILLILVVTVFDIKKLITGAAFMICGGCFR